jgi:hypothetical protein
MKRQIDDQRHRIKFQLLELEIYLEIINIGEQAANAPLDALAQFVHVGELRAESTDY